MSSAPDSWSWQPAARYSAAPLQLMSGIVRVEMRAGELPAGTTQETVTDSCPLLGCILQTGAGLV